jgi:dienelactone hydrolase
VALSEIVLIFAVLLALGMASLFADNMVLKGAAYVVLAGALLAHAHYGPVRLGMSGAYLAAAALVAWPIVQPSLPSWAAVFCALLTLSPLLTKTSFAPLQAPAPRGGFLVGSAFPQLRDLEVPGAEYRTPAVQLWYPVDSAESVLPLAYERRFRRQGIRDAPIADGPGPKFPLIFYFPGGSGTEMDGVNIARHLASEGFVVASLYYPLELPGLDPEALAKRRAGLEHDLFNFASDADFQASLRGLDERVRERARDASRVLDRLIGISEDAAVMRIRSRLSLNRVGAMGFSFGGATAAEAQKHDPRFKAALNMDGWHFGDAVQGVPRPYLLMISDETVESYERALAENGHPQARGDRLTLRDYRIPIAKMESEGGYLLAIPGTNHINFSDRAFSGSLVRDPPSLGRMNKHRAYKIISRVIAAFFDVHLREGDFRQLKSVASEYQDISLKSWMPAKEISAAQ